MTFEACQQPQMAFMRCPTFFASQLPPTYLSWYIMHAPLHAIVAILFSLALIGALADHSSVHLLPIEQSPDTNIAYKTSTALLQVSTTVPAYSVFEHVRDIQSHDVVLKVCRDFQSENWAHFQCLF